MSVVMDALGIVAIIAVTLAIILGMFLYSISNDVRKLFDLTASDIVAKDLSGLISLSASATNSIRISYEVKANTDYNGELSNRIITISKAGHPETSEKSSYAVDSISSSFSESKSFIIKKTRENNKNKYTFEAVK